MLKVKRCFIVGLIGSVCFAVAQQPAPKTSEVKQAEPEGVKQAPAESVIGEKTAPTAPGTDKLPPPPAGINANTYVIGPEDVLYVRVWKDNDLSGLVDVRPDGMISMQLIGEVKASGMTPEQLSKEITEKLLATHKHPEVNIQVVKVLSKKYFILGEVRRPGPYTFVVPTTILEALGNAGGFNDFANTKKIYLLRGKERHNFNYHDVSKGKHMEENIQVQNGDQLFVP